MSVNKEIKRLVDKNIWIAKKLNQTEPKREPIEGGYVLSEPPNQERKVRLIVQSGNNLEKLKELLPQCEQKTTYLERTLKTLKKRYETLIDSKDMDFFESLEETNNIEGIFRAFGETVKNYKP